MGATWLMVCLGLAWADPIPTQADAGATVTVPLATRLDKLKAEQADVPVPATFDVRNEMGNHFRLVEARFVVDGVDLVSREAPKGKELERTVGPLEAKIPAGNHVVTATLVFEGRNEGPFTYLNRVRYRVESTVPFAAGHLIGPAAVHAVARERPGATVPLEQKPTLAVTVTNNPAAVTSQKVPLELQPASAVTH